MRFTIMMKPEGKDVIESWKGKGPYGSKIVKVVPGKGQIKGESEWRDRDSAEGLLEAAIEE